MRLYDQTLMEMGLEAKMDAILEAGEEIPSELYAEYDQIQSDRLAKIASIGRWIKSLRGESGMLALEIARQRQRQAVIDSKIDSLENYLASCLKDDEKYQDPTVAIKWNPTSTDVFDESLLPQEFFKVKEVVSVNKESLLKELRAGIGVPGAKLKRSINIK